MYFLRTLESLKYESWLSFARCSLFERAPPIFDAPKEREAFATYEAGVLLSEAGRHGDAVANFVRAAKLAPDLAAELGI